MARKQAGMKIENIYVTQPSMPNYEEYIEAIRPLWKSHWLTNMGEYHQKLEEELKKYLGVSGISLMVNGHMALELAIQSFHFPYGSEIITTPFTFISTTHAIVRNNLCPIFCDVKMSDGTLDESKIEELITEKTVAILPVHVYGNICNIEKIKCIADKYSLKIIYDAAHAFGVKYKGKGIGNYGDASIFSFHATKVFNTIEGGAVTFSDGRMYDELYNLKNFGIRGEELVVSVGANAKMNEFAAIMGLCNLKHIDTVFAERKKRYEKYKASLENIKGIRILCKNETCNNYAYLAILIENQYRLTRDELYELFKRNNIFTRKYFYPLTSDEVCFKNKYRNAKLENSRRLTQQVLILPLYEKLEFEKIETIIDLLKQWEAV